MFNLSQILLVISCIFSSGQIMAKSEFPACPKDSFKTSFQSPFDSTTTVLCSKRINSEVVKHGHYWVYEDEKLQKKLYYENDQLTDPPKLANQDKPDKKNSINKDLRFVETIVKEVLYLWHPVTRERQKAYLALGGFETRSCYVNGHNLERFYLKKIEEFELSLKFSKRCSLRGDAKIIPSKPIQIKWKLNDLDDYTSIELLIQLDITPLENSEEKPLYRVKTEIKRGEIKSKLGSIEFNATYRLNEIDLDKKWAKGEHSGELFITKYHNQKVNQDFPLQLNILQY